MSNPSGTPNKPTLEFLWKTYSSITDWIKFSDAKAAAVLAANGVVVGFALSNASTINKLVNKHEIFLPLVIIGSLALYASTIFCLLCLLPKLSVGESSSIIFFAHIAKKTKTNSKDYRLAVDTVFRDNEELNQVKDQIWAISKVAKRKYFLVGWGIWLFAGMVIITLVFIAGAILIV